MLLKNLMEEKQLDFNQPLLSVRRYTPPVAASESEGKRKTENSLPKIPRPPVYKSELKSGPIRNPGTVPFVWEKTPGRPKEESNLQTKALQRPPVAPKLPPGRVVDDKQHSSRKASDGKALIPYQTGSALSSSQSVPSSNQIETNYESWSGELEETRSSGSKDSDEAYVDALSTLSRTESFFFNCSISGVSGLDEPGIKPSGIFSTDPQTRDFMMGRFLPAAKAVASETPPYATRKQPVAREPEREIKKLIIVDKQQPLYVSSPNNFQDHAQDGWCEESEDEDDYSQSSEYSEKVCGLFPPFLLKSSFCLLNPVPGMKIPAQKPVKPAYSVRTRQAKSLRYGGETEDELTKASSEKGLTVVSRMDELTEDKKNLNFGSSLMSYRSDCQKANGASPIRHLQGNEVSVYSSQTAKLIHQEKGFLGIPEKAKNYRAISIDPLQKGSKNFQELLAIESINQKSGAGSPVVEKTLYVDSVHKVKSPDSYYSDKALALSQHMEDDSGILVKPIEMEETPSKHSSLQDTKHFNSVADDKAIVLHKSMESVDSYSLFSSVKDAPDMKLDAKDDYRRDQHLIQESSKLACLNLTDDSRKDETEIILQSKLRYQQTAQGLRQDSTTFTKSKIDEPRKIGSESHLQMKSRSNQESSHGSCLKLPLGPPLPKAPSESWLKRTLPAVSSRNASSRSCNVHHGHYSGTQGSPAPSGDTKWETIVRSSNVHHGHLRFSEEQLPPIPEA